MPAGPAVILATDHRPNDSFVWQTMKSPGGLQTAVTAAKLAQAIRRVSFAEDNFEFIDVSPYESIRIQVWGVGSDDNAPVIDFYGWSDQGPGNHIGKLTATMGLIVSNESTNADPGWHTEANGHSSIRKSFRADTAYRGCDTYTVTNDYEQERIVDTAATPIEYQWHKFLAPPGLTSAGTAPPEINFPSYMNLNLSRARYKWLCAACTNLGSATSAGVIYRPVCYRKD